MSVAWVGAVPWAGTDAWPGPDGVTITPVVTHIIVEATLTGDGTSAAAIGVQPPSLATLATDGASLAVLASDGTSAATVTTT